LNRYDGKDINAALIFVVVPEKVLPDPVAQSIYIPVLFRERGSP
jgi:hypothetical protein